MKPDVIKYDVQYEYIQSHLISVWYQGVRLIARFLFGVEITLIRSSNQFGASCGSLFSFDLTAKTPPGPILTIRNWCCKLCHLKFIIETLGLQNGWIGLPKIGLSKIGFPKIGQSNIGHPNIGHPKMGHPAIGHSKNWWSENWWWVHLWSCRFLPGGNGIKWTTYLKLKKKSIRFHLITSIYANVSDFMIEECSSKTSRGSFKQQFRCFFLRFILVSL